MNIKDRILTYLDRWMELLVLSFVMLAPLSLSQFFQDPLLYKATIVQFFLINFFWAWFLKAWLRKQITYSPSPYTKPIIALNLVAGMSLLVTPSINLAIHDYTLIVAFSAAILILPELLVNRRFVRKILWMSVTCGLLISVISICQDNEIYGDLTFLSKPAQQLAGQLDFLPGVDEQFQEKAGRFFDGNLLFIKSSSPRHRVAATIGHNTGVSSYLIATFIFTLALIKINRRFIVRLLLLEIAAVHVYVIVVAQTRGVWIAFFPALLLFFYLSRTKFPRLKPGSGTGKKLAPFPRGLLLLTLLLVITGVMVGVLARETQLKEEEVGRPSIVERMTHFSPDVLIKGSRLRIWTISLQMIKAHPLMGVGLTGFKYDYPEYQGEYFATHPDSVLVPTPLHTERVHNEYLQPLVEFGFLGGVVVVWLFVVHRKWVIHLARWLPRNEDRILLGAAGAGLLAALIDGFVNFELHIITCVVNIVFMMALMTALGQKKGTVRQYSLVPVANGKLKGTALLIVLLWGSQLFIFYGHLRWAFADSHFNLGEEYRKRSSLVLSGELNPELEERERLLQGGGWLELSVREHKKALSLTPSNGLVHYQLGKSYYSMCDLLHRMGSPEKLPNVLFQSVKHLRLCQDEYQFKDIYYYLGRAYHLNFLLKNGPARQMFENAVANYRKVYRIYPDEIPARHNLGKLYLAADQKVDAHRTWQEAAFLDSNYVFEKHIRPARNFLAAGKDELARESYLTACRLDWHNVELANEVVDFLVQREDYEGVITTAELFLRYNHLDDRLLLKLLEATFQLGRYEEVGDFLEYELERRDSWEQKRVVYGYTWMLYLATSDWPRVMEFFDEYYGLEPDLRPRHEAIINLAVQMKGKPALAEYLQQHQEGNEPYLQMVGVLEDFQQNNPDPEVAGQLLLDYMAAMKPDRPGQRVE